MATLEDLSRYKTEIENSKAPLVFQLQEMNGSLARIHIRMAEIRDINRDTPTNALPDEMLAAIFEAGVTLTSYFSHQWPVFWSKEKPIEILISSVCRRWRNVALQTPRLWTYLHINVSKSTGDFLDLYISRSKMCLLDITFVQLERSHYQHAEFDFGNFKRYLGQLIPHVARWRQFVIRNLSIGSMFAAFSPLAALCAPALENMVIDCNPMERTVIKVFSAGAPLLSSLELLCTYVLPPGDAVKRMGFGCVHGQLSLTGFNQLIVHMRSLTHLSITPNDFAEDSTHLPRVELPAAVSLDLHLNHFSNIQNPSVGALGSLDLPTLESLTVHGSTAETIGAFTRHRRLYPTLRSLKLMSRFVNDKEGIACTLILDFIHLFPNIQDLAFHGAHPNPILHTLGDSQSTNGLLWPQLSVITLVPRLIDEDQHNAQTFGCIAAVVENRFTLGHPVAQIKLSSRILKRITPEQQMRLRELVEIEECYIK